MAPANLIFCQNGFPGKQCAGPLELPFEKGIVNDVVVDDGEDEAKVIGGNVVPKSRRVETFGENDEDEGGEAVVGENDEDEMSEDGGGKVGEAVVPH